MISLHVYESSSMATAETARSMETAIRAVRDQRAMLYQLTVMEFTTMRVQFATASESEAVGSQDGATSSGKTVKRNALHLPF